MAVNLDVLMAPIKEQSPEGIQLEVVHLHLTAEREELERLTNELAHQCRD